MRKIFTILFTCLSVSVFAQNITPWGESKPKLFIGLSSGINNQSGIAGGTIEGLLGENITAFGALGLSSWGYKTTIGMRYYKNYPQKWAFGGSISRGSGLSELKIDMAPGTVEGHSSTVSVPFVLKPAFSLNGTATRYWVFGEKQKNRFHLEVGYAVPLSSERYEVKGGYRLTQAGKSTIETIKPGGIILGLGLSFGI